MIVWKRKFIKASTKCHIPILNYVAQPDLDKVASGPSTAFVGKFCSLKCGSKGMLRLFQV